MGILLSTYYYYTTRTDDPHPVTTLTSRETYLVQSTWAPLKKNLTAHGVNLLIILFKLYPEEQDHFPFRNVPLGELKSSKKFAAHCSSVMYSVDSIVDHLNDGELLLNILEKIGQNHRRHKVLPISFWHTKEALLEMLAPLIDLETKAAWDKAITVAFGGINKELE